MNKFALLSDTAVYAQYLRRIDARALLDHYGAENVREQVNRDGSVELIHSCLLDRVEPHHSNGDANPSAAVNVDKRTFVCYSLGFGCDLAHLVMKLEGKDSFGEALTRLSDFLDTASRSAEDFRAELDRLLCAPDVYPVGSPPHYSASVLIPWLRPHAYWTARGVNDETCAKLLLGYDPADDRVVFPHFVEHQLVGWQKRAVSYQLPKYLSTSGFPKSDTLYNLDRAREDDRVCVVESPMSVARAVSLGLPNVVATFGAKVGQGQLDLLKEFKRVYVWFDRDAAGIAGERKLVEGLYRHTDVWVVSPDRGRDLADCGLGEIAEKLATAVPAAIRLGEYDGRRRG